MTIYMISGCRVQRAYIRSTVSSASVSKRDCRAPFLTEFSDLVGLNAMHRAVYFTFNSSGEYTHTVTITYSSDSHYASDCTQPRNHTFPRLVNARKGHTKSALPKKQTFFALQGSCSYDDFA